MTTEHPIYGAFKAGWRCIPQFENYEIDEYCNVRNAITNRTIKPNANFQVLLLKKKTSDENFPSVVISHPAPSSPVVSASPILTAAVSSSPILTAAVSSSPILTAAVSSSPILTAAVSASPILTVTVSSSPILTAATVSASPILTAAVLPPCKQRSFHRVHHLGLLAFFPHIKPLETVDHIDECRNNHHIINLQWLSNRENAIKSNQLRPRKRKIIDAHRFIQQRDLQSGIVIREFTPSELKKANFSLSAVKRCMAGNFHQYSNFCWTKKSDQDLPGEEWKTSDALQNRLSGKKLGGTPISEQTIKRIRVSNCGRILLANGAKSRGCKLLYSVYRRAFSVKMHILVWDVWGTRKRLPGECILHDDSQPHDSEGCVSNDIRYLRLGTQRDNMIEWHAQKRLRRSVSEKFPQT